MSLGAFDGWRRYVLDIAYSTKLQMFKNLANQRNMTKGQISKSLSYMGTVTSLDMNPNIAKDFFRTIIAYHPLMWKDLDTIHELKEFIDCCNNPIPRKNAVNKLFMMDSGK